MAEQLAALSALLGQQLEAEGWGGEAAAAAVLAAGGPGQLEPLLQVGGFCVSYIAAWNSRDIAVS